MPTLEEMLRASLKGANERFDQADKALHIAVAEAAKAVEAVTGGKATLRLNPRPRDEYGLRYDLVIVAKSRDSSQIRPLGILIVPTNGFPIHSQAPTMPGPDQQFNTAEDLSAYFQRLASNPGSPLVGYLAYIIRNPSESPSENGDPSPL
jgi:hypothetical protein